MEALVEVTVFSKNKAPGLLFFPATRKGGFYFWEGGFYGLYIFNLSYGEGRNKNKW